MKLAFFSVISVGQVRRLRRAGLRSPVLAALVFGLLGSGSPVWAKEDGRNKDGSGHSPKVIRTAPANPQPNPPGFARPPRDGRYGPPGAPPVYAPAPQPAPQPVNGPNPSQSAQARAQAEAERLRQELHYQLRAEQNRPKNVGSTSGAGAQGGTAVMPPGQVGQPGQPGQRLSPEERRVLREQVRDKRPPPPQFNP